MATRCSSFWVFITLSATWCIVPRTAKMRHWQPEELRLGKFLRPCCGFGAGGTPAAILCGAQP